MSNVTSKPKNKHVALLIGYLILIMVTVIFSAGASLQMNLENPDAVFMMKINQLVSVVFIFIVPVVLYVYFFTDEKFGFLQLHRFPNITQVGLTILIFIAAMPAINYMAQLNEQMSLPEFLHPIEEWMRQAEENAKKTTEAFLKMNNLGDLLLNLVVIALMAAFSEELFFRGALQQSLLKVSHRKHLAIWVSAVLFSALHGQFFGFFPRMVLGAVLGYVYLWTGSLWTPIIGHFVNNGTAVVMAYLVQKNILQENAENFGEQAVPLHIALISVALSGSFIYLLWKNSTSQNNQSSNNEN